ncbi:Ig-like domain-containing protein [Streptomyces pathocidini]|uniref:Ig-like domain-containing protein n=1 Tax=Streptomyces pathocidini TaxID=1650571 RepID=A0ABW7UUU2_9ACTN|nr:Ig-like domain-containing protein [Streptomyces pathocidini]
MSHKPRIRTAASCALLIAPLALFASACTDSHPLSATPYDASDEISFNEDEGGRIDPEKPLEISAKSGDSRITDVTATDASGRYLRGELTADGSRWRSTSPLAAGAHYTVRVSTEDEDGAPGRRTADFDTKPADKSLRVTLGPDSGTYGVGQPVTAQLSHAVKTAEGRATVERALHVDSRPSVEGAWHWVDSKTLHYRPQEYWPANSTVQVRSTLDGIKVGKNLYGGPAKALKLRIGDRLEAVTDAGAHTMTVKRNGKVIRTIPVTTGKPGFDTRNGVKVVLAKEPYVRMNGETVGIAEGSSESYDLDVYWATRVTWSGEYVHAAPWSAGSQGAANVSHGCTGMSTENAKWFFDTVKLGDIVVVRNSTGDMMTAFDNGFGDWNVDWAKWQEGSAVMLAGSLPGGGSPQSARLRPVV